jgi:hypothetical protein
VPIVLADGQEWHFPKPWLEVHGRFAGGKAVATFPVLTCGPELDELVEACSGYTDNTALLCAAATLGAHLLARNYDLADEDLDTLFAFRVGEPGSWDWARAVMDLATGQSGPKRGRGGAS